MDSFLARHLNDPKIVPPFNPTIANGIAVEHGKQALHYIDSILKDVARNFPPGLEYLGCQKCTPIEQFHFETAKKNSERRYDLAKSSIYLTKLFFRFQGVNLPDHYLYLPHIGQAGTLFLSGTRYLVSPMLSDVAFSPSERGVFKRLLRDKLNFERSPHHLKINGQTTSVQVAHSTFYHRTAKMRKMRPMVKAECTLAHYLFCKYGVTETFRKFGHCEVTVGTTDTVTPLTHPDSEWVIVSSRGVKPAGLGKSRYIETNELAIAVRKEDYTVLTKALMVGFIYVVDHFPERMQYQWVDEKGLWMRLLGLILFSNTIPEGKIHDDIQEHIRSLDEYIDSIVAIKLRESGYDVQDIYELIVVVLTNIDEWIRSAHSNMNSMYGKELTVLYNVLYVITEAIFNTHYKLKAASRKGLKLSDVTKILQTHLRPKLIHRISKGNNCISMDSYSGDSKILSITTKLVPQKNHSRQGGQKERTSVKDGTKRLHVSVAEVGGFSNLPKSEPSGRSCINMHVQVSPKGKILRDPRKIELLDKVQAMLTADIK